MNIREEIERVSKEVCTCEVCPFCNGSMVIGYQFMEHGEIRPYKSDDLEEAVDCDQCQNGIYEACDRCRELDELYDIAEEEETREWNKRHA